jgi:hypothetical protein
MATDHDSSSVRSSCSEEENHSNCHRMLSSTDTDADESDNDNKRRCIKSRRFQKTRKTSNSSIIQKYENNTNHHTPPLSRTNLHTNEQVQHQSSSNDDNTNESNSITNGNNQMNLNNRRTKLSVTKKSHY